MHRHAEPDQPANNTGRPCLTCPDRPDKPRRPARQGNVCDACRSRLTNNLREIARNHAALAWPDKPAPEDGWDIHEWDRRNRKSPRTGHDPIAYETPAGPIAGQRAGGRVSGSKDGHSPINLAAADLTSAARQHPVLALTRIGRESAEDQIGDLAVATTLDFWVRDWREARERGERLPAPKVTTLVEWLVNRLDWACDEHMAVDEFARDVFALRGRLRGVMGLIDVPDYKKGVPCRRCDRLTLVRRSGSDWIECDGDGCNSLMSPDEYAAWTKLLSRHDHDDLTAQYKPVRQET